MRKTARVSLIIAAAAAALVALLGSAPAQSPPETAATQADQPDCAVPVDPASHAALYAPEPKPARHHAHKDKKHPPPGGNSLSDDPVPVLQAQTAACTQQAADRYRKIANDGGWPMLARTLRGNAAGSEVALLRKRLAIEGDLDPNASTGDHWDDAVTKAVKHFQWRAGLRQSGEVDAATLAALNVPADMRARELADSAQRIAAVKIPFDRRYVVVNIPAAAVEAVENGRAVQRHAAIAGDVDHQSPQLTARITGVTINPTWTIPRSIVEHEVLPRLARDPNYLRRAKIRILNRRGHQISARRIDWSDVAPSGLVFRQEPGRKNSLGTLRIDMPNPEHVYLHDTPAKRAFADNYRFLSHGCVRVDGVYDLAAWLLRDAKSRKVWNRSAIADVAGGKRKIDIALAKPVTVAWVYLDAWESADGEVHFRPDVYNLDGAQDGQTAARASPAQR